MQQFCNVIVIVIMHFGKIFHSKLNTLRKG